MAATVLSTYDFRRLSLLVEKHTGSPSMEKTVLRRLQQKLESALVLPPERMPSDIVTLYTQVRVVDPGSGKRTVFTLVFPGETVRGEESEGRRRVSMLAPVGVALIGERVGARVEYRDPQRTLRFKVEALLYQPEAAGVLYA